MNDVMDKDLETKIRRKVREKKVTFEQVLELVQHRQIEAAAIQAAVTNSESMEPPALDLNDDTDVMVGIYYLRDNYDFPGVLTDAIVVALLLTQAISDRNDPEMVEALCEWFSLLEGDFRLGDDDRMPKQVLGLCRTQLVLN